MNNRTIIDPLPATKACTICGEMKPLEEFSPRKNRRLGYHSHCKECRARCRRFVVALNREKTRAQRRKYYISHKEQEREYRRQRQLAFPEKIRAVRIVDGAIRRGKLLPASECLCWVCGIGRWEDPGIVMEYHHPDYSKPLAVIPLCTTHHARLHANLRNLNKDEYT